MSAKHERDASARAGSFVPASRSGVHEGAALVAVFSLAAVFALRELGNADLGFHLAHGGRILDGAGWPRVDGLTYTVADHPYIDTSWGFQVVVAQIERLAGATGLVIAGCLAVLAVLGLVAARAALDRPDPAKLATLLLLGVLATEIRFDVRPEWCSYGLLAVVLLLLERHARGLSAPLWLLPVLHALWANVHSLFVLGWMALGCFVVGLGLRDRRLDWRLAAWAAASVPAVLLNPYGWKAPAFALSLVTRLSGSNVFGRDIGELFSVAEVVTRPHYPRAAVAALVMLSSLALVSIWPLWRRHAFHHVLLAVAFVPLGLTAIRNAPLPMIACLPAIAATLSSSVLSPRLAGIWNRTRPAVALGVVLIALGVGLRAWHGAWYVADRRAVRSGLGWNEQMLPIGASAWAARTMPGSRVLNDLAFGGYLAWSLDRPVFIDSRLEVMGEAFYEEYNALLASSRAFDEGTARWGVDWIVLTHRRHPEFVSGIMRDPRWRLAYVDALAAAWVRSGESAVARIDASARRIAEGPHGGIHPDLLPGLGGGPRSAGTAHWLAGFVQTREYPEEDYRVGIFHYIRGEMGPAAEHFTAAIAASGGAYPEIYLNLGAALASGGRLEHARRSYRAALDAGAEPDYARERLAEIERRARASGSR